MAHLVVRSDLAGGALGRGVLRDEACRGEACLLRNNACDVFVVSIKNSFLPKLIIGSSSTICSLVTNIMSARQELMSIVLVVYECCLVLGWVLVLSLAGCLSGLLGHVGLL